MAGPYIRLENICKSFGSVQANKNVSIDVNKGEILARLGENGSGKSTLVNMLSGIYTPDSGRIFIDGKQTVFSSPKDAIKAGIGMVHQHFKLVDVMTAAENIVIGQEKGVFTSKKRMAQEIGALNEKYGLKIIPDKKIYNMSVSEKQSVEIMKILYRGADVLILDEPTAVLTPQEITALFDILRRMKEQGCSIIIITHKMAEVMDISDRVTVLRKGESIATVVTKETTPKQLTEMMVGGSVSLEIERPRVTLSEKPLLAVKNLTKRDYEGVNVLNDVSFDLYGGEILGVAGIAGCGQKELCEAMAGLRKIESGMIIHEGESIVGLSPQKILEKGVAMSFIPEDRLGMGLAPSLSITDNMILKKYNQNHWNPFVDRKTARKEAQEVIDELEVVTPSTEIPVRRLSGGNVQKILLGREIKSNPNVLITAYPVRGLDINSSYMIYNILDDLKQKGVGVLFVGEDLDVLMALCDKIMVLCHGKVMGVVHASKTSKEELGLMMTGAVNLSVVNGKVAGIAKDSTIKEEDVQ